MNDKNIIVPGDLIQYGTFGYWATGMAVAVDINNDSLVAFIVSDDCGHSDKTPIFIKLPIIGAAVFKLNKTNPKPGYIPYYDMTKNIIDNLGVTLDSLQKRLTFE